jgi:hypothetical protein
MEDVGFVVPWSPNMIPKATKIPNQTCIIPENPLLDKYAFLFCLANG